MRFRIEPATPDEVGALSELHIEAAGHLTRQYGVGPWSSKTSEEGVLRAMRTSRVYTVREGSDIVGAMCLTTRKP